MKKILIFIPLFILLLTGCSADDSGTLPEGKIYAYELDTEGNGFVPIVMELTGEDTEMKVKEVISVLQKSSEEGDYRAPLSNDIYIRSVRENEGTVTIDFDSSYEKISCKEPMARASIVRSVCQIEGVNSVNFMIEGKPLTDSSGNVIGDMNSKTFIYDFEERNTPNQEADLVLYYPASDGSGLYKEERHVEYNTNTPIGRVVLSELKKAPETEGAAALFPTDVNITSFAVSDGICFVSFDSGFSSQISESSGKLPVMAVVDSLTEISSIKKVMITVTGENENEDDPTHVGGLYEKDLSIVLNMEEEAIE